MSRSSAAFDDSPANDWSSEARTASMKQPSWAEDKNPTRPLPVFRLEEEARRLDQEVEKAAAQEAATAAMRCDEDATVTVSAEDNLKLLASILPGAPHDAKADEPSIDDDEPTLDAPAPSEIAAILPRPVRVTARPPALKMLVITKPAPPPHTPRSSLVPGAPIFVAASAPLADSIIAVAPQSGFHSKVPFALLDAARDARPTEELRRTAATFKLRLRKPDTTTYVVAGIWAMALSLLAVLMFMVTSA